MRTGVVRLSQLVEIGEPYVKHTKREETTFECDIFLDALLSLFGRLVQDCGFAIHKCDARILDEWMQGVNTGRMDCSVSFQPQQGPHMNVNQDADV